MMVIMSISVRDILLLLPIPWRLWSRTFLLILLLPKQNARLTRSSIIFIPPTLLLQITGHHEFSFSFLHKRRTQYTAVGTTTNKDYIVSFDDVTIAIKWWWWCRFRWDDDNKTMITSFRVQCTLLVTILWLLYYLNNEPTIIIWWSWFDQLLRWLIV